MIASDSSSARPRPATIILLLALLPLTACSTAYYKTMETFGVEKRDLLRSNVVKMKEDQIEVQEQFQDTLKELRLLSGYKGGDLEKVYDRLEGEYNRSESRAGELRSRIEKVNDLAGDLFKEWEDEITQYSSDELKDRSRAQLRTTKEKFADLNKAMKKSEARMDPVLARFKDQVLFLKHNLNAQVVAGLDAEVGSIQTDVDALIREMTVSIREADAFISTLPK